MTTAPFAERQAVEQPADEVPQRPRLLRAVGPGRPSRRPEPAPRSDADVAQAAHLAVEHLNAARSPEVAAGDPWAEAGRKVLGFHLSRMLARVPGTIAGEDPEEVHAMRVASRRVRAGWRVFGDAFEGEVVRDHVRQLKVIGAQLGEVRDLDVQIAILADTRERRSKRERLALTPLVDDWTAQRAARHGELVDRLRSAWFSGFIDDHESLLTTPGAGARPVDGNAPDLVRMRAPAVAWQAYQTAWAFESALPDADVSTLHELRIATKWLRYTLEFLREPMEPQATDLIRRVVALQDQLGDIHDFQASAERARATAAASPDLRPGQRAAIERFIVAKDLRVERLCRRLGPTWRGMADADYRRRLGRSLARL